MTAWRYERKFRLEQIGQHAIARELRNHPAGFRIQYPDRQINNVYFDSPELQTFKENLAGISDRAKYRLRWYGKSIETGTKFRWEIKHKHNTLGKKTVESLTDPVSLDDLHGLRRRINKNFRGPFDFVPTLINAYSRSYYISADGFFRMTIDRELAYFPVTGARRFARYNCFDPGVILELKYDQEHDDHAQEILDFIPYRQTKSSKYVTGILMAVE